MLGPILLVFLLVAFLLLRGGGDPDPSAEPAPAPSTSETGLAAEPEPDESAPAEGELDGQASPQASAEESPSPSPTAPACSDSDLLVTATLDSESYGSGSTPNITLTIANTSSADCQRDIGAGANEIVITSGGYHVWSSDDCDPSEATDEQVLEPGAQAQVTVTWDRTLSAPGCTGAGSAAQPGTYEVEGRNGSVVGDPVRFVLS